MIINSFFRLLLQFSLFQLLKSKDLHNCQASTFGFCISDLDICSRHPELCTCSFLLVQLTLATRPLTKLTLALQKSVNSQRKASDTDEWGGVTASNVKRPLRWASVSQ